MADMTIELQIDPATGKKNILVSLSADADSLPPEHVELHRKPVDKLIQGGILKASELGKIIIERGEETGETAAAPQETPQEQRRAQKGGA